MSFYSLQLDNHSDHPLNLTSISFNKSILNFYEHVTKKEFPKNSKMNTTQVQDLGCLKAFKRDKYINTHNEDNNRIKYRGNLKEIMVTFD